MPRIFKLRDIEKMSAQDVTQELVDYYSRFSEERKKEFAESRPDLVAAILAWASKDRIEEILPIEDEEVLDEEFTEFEEDEVTTVGKEIVTEGASDFSEIEKNVYEGQNLLRVVKDDFRPVEALVIDDKYTKCPVHRTNLIRLNPSFHRPDGAVLGRNFYCCPQCNRLFIKQSQLELNHEKLEEWGVPHKFYDYELSRKYLDSKTVPYEIADEEKIYVPDLWIEEKPVCPIHDSPLEELPCVRKYENKEIRFHAFYCEACKKVILRRTNALNLEDRCAEIGIPLMESERLVKKTPRKEPVSKQAIKPDYYMNDGHRVKYGFDSISECYQLSEMDTVVVSDSLYCNLDGHDTEMVLGLLWVRERSGDRKSYLCKLGYCAECQKYYMEEIDYKSIYERGRPEVTVFLDLDDDSYRITSGEVFTLEKDHLQKTEDTIDSRMQWIRNQPDYVNPYATLSYYDDGGLKYAKAVSERKYQSKLIELNSYKDQPYKYRVDIGADGETEVYYVGSTDIDLGENARVISANSQFGRELIHYKTIKIKKNRKEYGIKLSREFDITKARLFGYTNLRTDEDIVFRKGVTDPFLVRVLNMRKRQHNLIDIFVTIQENQNRIVDAKFGKSLIVQGCAGSGKTMVLLHRLSSLKYNRPDFDFNREALILTPNEQFSLHITGLAEELQIGSIERLSIEKYYSRVLAAYSDGLRPKGSIASEMLVKQNFVDYIYSDEFKRQFDQNYYVVTEPLKHCIEKLQSVLTEAGEKAVNIAVSRTTAIDAILPKLNTSLEALLTKVNQRESEVKYVQQQLNDLIDRKATLETSFIPKQVALTTKTIKDSIAFANTKLTAALLGLQKQSEDNNKQILQLQKEQEHLRTDITALKKTGQEEIVHVVRENAKLLSADADEIIESIEEARNQKNIICDDLALLTEILSHSVEEILAGQSVPDGIITEIQARISDAEHNISIYKEELTQIEASRIPFGKRRRMSRLQNQIEEAKKAIELDQVNIREAIARNERVSIELQEEINQMQRSLDNRASSLINEIIRKKQARIGAATRKVNELESKIASENANYETIKNLTYQQNDLHTESDIVDWLKRLSEYVPSVRDDLRLCKRMQIDTEDLERTKERYENDISDAKKRYTEALANCYPNAIVDRIIAVKEELTSYSAPSMFQKIFDMTVNPVKEKYGVKSIVGRLHRYDLYAQLHFALRYYGKPASNYRFICIDEGQDLAMNEYRLIAKLNGKTPVFNIFGDTNQLIKPGRGISAWSTLEEEFHADQYILNENYRNTNQITRFCNDSFGMKMLQTGVDGVKVREITRKEFDKELSNLTIDTERVAILIPRNIQKKLLNEELMNSNVRRQIGNEIGQGRIALMYVDEVKGIEFDKVYVISNRMGRNEKYIAYTRALSELIIVVDDELLA